MTDQEAFDSLSSPIRHFIRQKGWTSFRPIQRAAIERIMTTDRNFILASRTASGKTEAAFLPILSKVNFNEPGVQVLYISPLIALINDQMDRVTELCQYLDAPVTKWHGEAKQSAKNNLLKDPRGILLITPESIEAMFIHHPGYISTLFPNLRYIIVDEIHYFWGTDRGIQLQSLITRISQYCVKPPIFIGLSATIGDFTLAKKFTGNEDNTSVLLDPARKPIDVSFKFFKSESRDSLPIDLLKDVFRGTYNHKALIFPNRRSTVEEISVGLKRLAELTNAPSNYFAHHASVDRGVREYVEFFAKNSNDTPFAICCTSTLELGIDIGSVDLIVQVNATYSISSLVQRAGRSGRKEGQHAQLIVYSTLDRKLVQALACWNLHEQGIIEAPETVEKPFDILLHQMLSIVRECSEITDDSLIGRLLSIPVFSNITRDDCICIIKHLLRPENQILELLDDKLIIGIDGERIVGGREYYTVFQPEKNFQVFCSNKKIGELSIGDFDLKVGTNVFLAAKVWTIIDKDYSKLKLYVEPAIDGRPPKFDGSHAFVSPMIEQEMLRILYNSETYDFLDEKSAESLKSIRKDFATIPCYNVPIAFASSDDEQHNETSLYMFWGTKVNNTVAWLFKCAGADCEYDDMDGILYVVGDAVRFKETIQTILSLTDDKLKESLYDDLLSEQSPIQFASKFGWLLPISMQADILFQKMYNVPAAKQCMKELYQQL